MMSRLLVAALAAVFGAACAGAAEKPKVYVVLWFDTEDYMLPASDDAALQVANWLHQHNIKATFKVVGEKARTLERRGRTDVINALKKHEIGYHSNFHSVQPTPAMYLSNLGWDEGVAEFDRRERPGFDDVRRIFGTAPTCYGQPGSSWGPQSFGAMARWGMPIYLDAGRHITVGGRPHFYGGLFTLYHLTHTIRTNLGGEKDLKPAEDRFLEARKQLLAEGGGVVSIVYHPCEFVHQKFWDGVNFSRGANPPREKWQLPPQKTAAESKTAYDTFYAYISFIQRFADVRFVTATEMEAVYKDRARGADFNLDLIRKIAQTVGSEIDHQQHGDLTLAPSEILWLLNESFVAMGKGGQGGVKLPATPYGPTGHEPAMTADATTDASQFERTALDVAEFMRKQQRVPSAVWLGSTPITPEAYLAALAKTILDRCDGKPTPETIVVKPAKLAAARHAAPDGPNLWGWVIFPPGFRAPQMMELARRQTWTVKPAILHGEAARQ